MSRAGDQPNATATDRAEGRIKLRQGSIIPPTERDKIDLSRFRKIVDPVLVVISHDCDLVQPHQKEPGIELICGEDKDKFGGGLSNAQSPRTLQLSYTRSGQKRILELQALNKLTVDKAIMAGVDPDPSLIIDINGLRVLRLWLAARYNRAAFPDELIKRMGKHIAKVLSSADREAIHGIWMRWEPKDNSLPADAPYELWIKVVYSTMVQDGRTKAEHFAANLRPTFERAFLKDSVWHSIDLESCEAMADTVFSVRDLLDYAQWRLEHLSLGENSHGEYLQQ